jgi:hypothetical protein
MYLMNVFTLLSTAKRQFFIWNSAIKERLLFILHSEATKVRKECFLSLAEMCADISLIGSSLIIGKVPLSEYNEVNIFPFISVCFSDYVFFFTVWLYEINNRRNIFCTFCHSVKLNDSNEWQF